MSDTMNTPLDRRAVRLQLLSTASAIALIGSICGMGCANAASSDEDRPTFWIELGGQAEAISGQGQPFTAPFMVSNANSPAFDPVSPLTAQKPPQFSFGEEGKISFQPEESNWIFSAAVRIGRSGSSHSNHQQTSGLKLPTTSLGYKFLLHPYNQRADVDNYAQYRTQHSESHAILDFQAGRDVAIGLFGSESTSVFNVGVRVARYDAKATADIKARPDLAVYGHLPTKYWHDFHLTGQSERSFHGIGPTISWDGSAAVTGDSDNGELTVDWGVNVGLLFGRQSAKIKHSTSDDAFKQNYTPNHYVSVYHHTPPDQFRARSVTVTNFGGFAGISYRFSRAALSIGYRADFFSGAIDGGIDAAEKSTLGFHGPFATVSIGVGG